MSNETEPKITDVDSAISSILEPVEETTEEVIEESQETEEISAEAEVADEVEEEVTEEAEEIEASEYEDDEDQIAFENNLNGVAGLNARRITQ